MRRVAVVSCLVSMALAIGTALHADEITVTSGQATVAAASGPVTMTLGFDDETLSMRWLQSFVLPRVICASGCHTGDPLSLNTTTFHTGPVNTEGLENDAVGTLTDHGVRSPLLAFTGSLSFVTPGVLVPQSSADFVTLIAPFTLSGTIQGFNANGRDPVLVFTDTLSGQGTATANLSRNPNTNTFQQIAPIQYDFTSAAATPEPDSWLLMACGVALMLVWRARHRRERACTRTMTSA